MRLCQHGKSAPITIYPQHMLTASRTPLQLSKGKYFNKTRFRFVHYNLTWPSWTWRKREWALSNWKKKFQKRAIKELSAMNTIPASWTETESKWKRFRIYLVNVSFLSKLCHSFYLSCCLFWSKGMRVYTTFLSLLSVFSIFSSNLFLCHLLK